MVHRIKILLTAAAVSLLAILALGETIAAADDDGIGAALAPILETYTLDESNFAMGYYNTLTGETWYYNEDAAMNGGSVYKLPLNMLYEEQLRAGERSPEEIIPVYLEDGSEAGYKLEVAMAASLIESNNPISEGMRQALADYPEFRRMQAKYFGVEADALQGAYATDNLYNARYAIHMLGYLYEHSDDYPIVLDLMKQAQPKAFFHAKITDYEVAHKYGSFEGYLNDVGIIYTDEPFLLAVFTYQTNADVLGDVASAMADYTVEQNTKYSNASERHTPQGKAAEYVPETASVTEPPVSPVPTATPADKASIFRWQFVLDMIPLLFVCAYFYVRERAKGK